ncbi:hypothetical protein D3C71_1173070 [compost metagenome]
MGHLIRFIATGEILNAVAFLLQDTGSGIASQPNLAVYPDFLAVVQFVQPVPQFVYRNVDGAFDMTVRMLHCCPDVNQHYGFRVKVLKVRRNDDFGQSENDILRRIACHVNGVLGRRVRRSICKLQFCQILDRSTEPDDGGDIVNSFVHTVIADSLRAEHLACGVKDQLHRQWHCSGIIRSMGAGMNIYGLIGKA